MKPPHDPTSLEPTSELRMMPMTWLFRVVGWGFLLVGGLMLAGFLFVTFNPEGEMTVNHVKTRDFETKLFVSLCVAIFPAIGALLAFLPRSWLAIFANAQRRRS